MIIKENLLKPIQYYDTALISIILSMVTIPFLWFISKGDIRWIIASEILWSVGVFSIFHPFIRYIFPYMLTKMGTFLLSSILALLTIGINISIILLLLPNRDMEMIFNYTLFNTSLSNIALFVWFYILIAGTLLSNLELRLSIISSRHKKFLQNLASTPLFSYNLFKYYSETLLVFIFPVALLFWTEITYSSRLLLGLLSIGTGFSLFIYRLESQTAMQRVTTSLISLIAIFVINISVVNLFGIEKIPATHVKARISNHEVLLDLQANAINRPSFQFSTNQYNANTSVYRVLFSIPQIGLHLGHRVATIPNQAITIKASQEQYTVEDQYNKTLLTLER